MSSIKEGQQLAQPGTSNPESSVLPSYFILQIFGKRLSCKTEVLFSFEFCLVELISSHPLNFEEKWTSKLNVSHYIK